VCFLSRKAIDGKQQGFPCPWCHRVLLALTICNLEEYFQIEYCEANISDGSWKLKGGESIRNIYRKYEVITEFFPMYCLMNRKMYISTIIVVVVPFLYLWTTYNKEL